MSKQYGLSWNQVDFERRQIHLPKTKNGDPRTIPRNAMALRALQDLKGRDPKGEDLKGAASGRAFPSLLSGDAL